MARVQSNFPISGTINGITFVRTKYGNFARAKSRINKNDFKTSPSFAKMREQNDVFGKAAKYGGLIRKGFSRVLTNAKQSDTSRRLTKLLFSIIKTAGKNERGEPDMLQSDLDMLKRFEFNTTRKLSSTLYAPYNVHVNREEGVVTVVVNDFDPATAINAPVCATECKLTVAVAELKFDEVKVWHSDVAETRCELARIAGFPVVEASFTANSRNVILVAIGIDFYETFNSKRIALTPSALAIVEVSQP